MVAKKNKVEDEAVIKTVNPDESPANKGVYVGVDPIYQYENIVGLSEDEKEADENAAKAEAEAKAKAEAEAKAKASGPAAPAAPASK